MTTLILSFALLAQNAASIPERTRDSQGWWLSPAGLKHRIVTPKSSKGRPGLVLLLHGSSGGYGPVEYEFKDPCLKAGYVVVTPRSTRFEDPNAPDKKWLEPDYPKLEALTRELVLAYGVDRTRVWMVGMSNGNRGGNVVFDGAPDLYAGFVSMGGGPAHFSPNLTDEDKRLMGIYYIIGSDDPWKRETDQSLRLAKEAGLKDIVYKVYPGLGHVCPRGSSKEAIAWMGKDRRKALAGNLSKLSWVEKPSTPPRGQFVYAYSDEARYLDACMAFEWDWFGDPNLIERVKAIDCVRLDLKKDVDRKKKLSIRGPSVLLLSPEGKVKMRVKASELLRLRRAVSRAPDPFVGHRAFTGALMKKLDRALK